jgi:GntR family transcriptional repressor for pyruvate dehydrogenase complex
MQFRNLGRTEKLSDRVSRELEEAILKKRLEPAERLPTEGELCKSFGVSRTVVREALQRLAARGLVHSVAGSGSFVASSNLGDLERCLSLLTSLHADQKVFLELLDLRLLIETELVARLAAAPSPASLRELRSALAAMKANVHDCQAFASADTAFHRAIVDGVGNNLFAAIWKPLAPLAHRYGLETYDVKYGQNAVLREHRAILRAIAERDVEGARRAMQEHLASSRRHFLTLAMREIASNGNAAGTPAAPRRSPVRRPAARQVRSANASGSAAARSLRR